MINYYTMDVHFAYEMFEGEDPGQIGDFMDGVVEHLQDALSVDDVSLILDEENRSFMVSMLTETVEGDAVETMVGKGMGALRTALHFCGGHTPDWPEINEALRFNGVSLTPADVPELVG